MPFLFAITLFVSATLLFLVEPMVAKMVLPLLGGTPAVWNTCMVFFQAALLAGYAYAHATTAWLGTRRQVLLHVVLMALPLLVLPIGLRGWAPPPDANPIPSLLLMLTLSVGLPFFVLSASAPLLQKWFAATDHPSAKDPYFLYAASNVGSMLALFAYPALVEPNLHLKAEKWFAFDTQSGLWALGYGLLALLMLGCALVVWQSPRPVNHRKQIVEEKPETTDDAPPSLLRKLHWLALAFVPSSMMLGVTTYITLDIAAIPLLWVIPLGLYLLSFILVFARWPAVLHRIVILGAPLAILLLVFVKLADPKGVVLKIAVHLLALFMVAMLCHGELARTRPSTRYLTGFYLLMSLGGVLGGLFNALVAPLVFKDLYEYPIAIVLACMLVPAIGPNGNFWLLRSILRWFSPKAAAPQMAETERSVASTAITKHSGKSEPRASTAITRHSGRPASSGSSSAGGLLAWLEAERGIGYQIASIAFDAALAALAGLVTYGFVRFFHGSSFRWDWLNSAHASVQGWIDHLLEYLKKSNPKTAINEAQVLAILTYGLPILLCYAFVTRPVRFGLGVAALFIAASYASLPGEREYRVIHQERSFFGVLKVEYKADPEKSYLLMHGTTTHGMQIRSPEHEFEPLTYYHQTGPIGQVFAALRDRLDKQDVGLIGLGSGTLACYGRPGQRFHFYDIDRTVEKIAKNPEYFTYYRNCKADKEVILGDARLKMEEANAGQYQLIIVDAFSSDAIPIHLITREAIELYFSKMKPDGVLAVHISNRYLNLEPVLGNIAEELGYVALREKDDNDENEVGKYTSDWVILARKSADCGTLLQDKRWLPAERKESVGVWTDDFSNLLSVFER